MKPQCVQLPLEVEFLIVPVDTLKSIGMKFCICIHVHILPL